MARFVGTVIFLAGLCAGLVVLSFGFYELAGWAAGVAVSLGAPPSYGASIANLLALMLVVIMIIASVLVVAERKWSAMIQDRIGPNRIKVLGSSLGGMPFLLADGLKMLTKEATEPATASNLLFNLAPILNFTPVFVLAAIVPFGPSAQAGGYTVSLQVASLDAGLLYVFALASIAVYGTALAGWSSNNKLALLGGVRASSQMISYEVSLGLSLVGCMMAYQTLRLDQMTLAQGQLIWGFWPALGFLLQPFGFLAFFASALAESKRAPFDLPEGESEIVGYFVEYSGMKFGAFMLTEFVEVAILGAIIAAVFFGGWHPIFFEGWLRANLPPIWFAALCGGVFIAKTLFFSWLQLMIRWTFPRFRYDQIQKLTWRMLLPLGLLNVFVTAAAVLVDPSLELLALVGIVELAFLAVITWLQLARAPEQSGPALPRVVLAGDAGHH